MVIHSSKHRKGTQKGGGCAPPFCALIGFSQTSLDQSRGFGGCNVHSYQVTSSKLQHDAPSTYALCVRNPQLLCICTSHEHNYQMIC